MSGRSTVENNRAWEATRQGRYQEALDIYNALAAEEELHIAQNGRGLVHLLNGNAEAALADFRAVSELPPPPVMMYPFVGVALWLKGEPAAACAEWAQRIEQLLRNEITHCDETGDVPPLLWWASCFPAYAPWRKLAVTALKRRWRLKGCQRSVWPGSIVAYLLGLQSEADFLAASEVRPDVVLRARRHCQAHFYIAAQALDTGDQKRYEEHLVLATTPIADHIEARSLILKPEYHLAAYETRRFQHSEKQEE